MELQLFFYIYIFIYVQYLFAEDVCTPSHIRCLVSHQAETKPRNPFPQELRLLATTRQEQRWRQRWRPEAECDGSCRRGELGIGFRKLAIKNKLTILLRLLRAATDRREGAWVGGGQGAGESLAKVKSRRRRKKRRRGTRW